MKRPSAIVSLEVNEEIREKILAFYSDYQEENSGEFIDFFARFEGTSITVYKPNKSGKIKAVFAGANALGEARIFDENAEAVVPKPKPAHPLHPIINRFPQIGSDEVGTGDLFGPVVVCAAYVEAKDLDYLNKLGVTDSKLLSDETILSIGKRLLRRFDYSLLVLNPAKYNEVHDERNMNAIKAEMHNRALWNLKARHPMAEVYLDQFVDPDKYYSYLGSTADVVKDICFSTKGELHFPSVALGSVIARYTFLKKMEQLSKKLGAEVPHGAGDKADAFLAEYRKDHSEKELASIAKMNFSNIQKEK